MDESALTSDQVEHVDQYMEVTGVTDRKEAIKRLVAKKWNIDRALDAFLANESELLPVAAEAKPTTKKARDSSEDSDESVIVLDDDEDNNTNGGQSSSSSASRVPIPVPRATPSVLADDRLPTQYPSQKSIREKERAKIRADQESAYRISLATDRARIAKRKQQEHDEEVEKKKRMEEEIAAENKEAARRVAAAALVPSEPASTESNVIHIRFRLPGGKQIMRNFRTAEPISTLIDFLSSEGFPPEESRFFNSDYPRKNIVASFDVSQSFAEANWPKREQVFVEGP